MITAAVCAAGCATSRPPAGPAEWIAWQEARHEAVGGPDGWTTLAGLHWLSEGDHTAGSQAGNAIVLPSGPPLLGTFSRRGESVFFAAAPGADVRVNGRNVQTIAMATDARAEPVRIETGGLSMVAIQRGDRFGLRVRDREADSRRAFRGLECFPYDPGWRLEGRFARHPEERTLRVPDVTGGFQELASPGELLFVVRGVQHRLAAALEPGRPRLFILFQDETAGRSTYPAGRYLYVDPPESGDRVVIDFNYAFTPPCAFTDFATCPFPPRQNCLPFAVTAGEKLPAGL